MPSRREFLKHTFQAVTASAGLLSTTTWVTAEEQLATFKGLAIFNRILKKAHDGKWSNLVVGDLVGKIAKEFEGTPYADHTLELSDDREVCSVNLTAFDCVTFYEVTLAFARMLKKGGRTPADLLAEVGYLRYRGGVPGDYSTRLHYTTDWFADNETKGVVHLLSDLPGAEVFTQKVGFMTSHPGSYRQLVKHPELVSELKRHEDAINARTLKFVPMNKLADAEPLLKTGDIVAVCTSLSGLDIEHTGLVYRTSDGVAHFMDASSMKQNMKVTLEPGPISQALGWSKRLTGAMFARPLELGKPVH